MQTKSLYAPLAVLGRAGLAALFVLGGINKTLNFGDTQARMVEAGLGPAEILLPATILLELLGGLRLIYGHRASIYAAGALCLFTLATNFWFHRFWQLEGDLAALELSLFFKNVAIAGALLFYAAAVRSMHADVEPDQVPV